MQRASRADVVELTAKKYGSFRPNLHAFVQSDVAVALLIFVLALAVRWHFAATHPSFDNIFSVRGVPFSDGQTWTSAAIRLTHGQGFGDVYRPFYSLFLALFFVWTGWSFTTITCLNILIGALSGSFLFLTARLSFNRWIGLAVAIFFAFDPSQITQTPQAVTEPLGLLFFIVSIYFMLEVGASRSASAIVLSGFFFGLSNLTRPLTLFCAPVYAVLLLVFEWSRGRKVRWAITIVSLFALGIAASMGPWLIRQKLVHNVWSVSTNLGEALYGATSPIYRTWTAQVRLDADRAGVPRTVGARYSFFMTKSVQQIRENPSFYLRQSGNAFWSYLICFDRDYRRSTTEFSSVQRYTSHIDAQTLFIFTVGTMLLLAGLWQIARKETPSAGIIFLFISSALIAFWRFLPPAGNFLILATGFVLGFVSGKSRQNVLLLAASLLVTGIGNAIFNNAILYRAVLMTDWLFACFYLAAFFYAASGLTSLVLRKDTTSPPTSEIATRTPPVVATFESHIRLVSKILVVFFVLFAGVSATRLVLAGARSEHRSKTAVRLNTSQKIEILQKLRTLSASLDHSLPSPAEVQLYVAPSPTETGGPTLPNSGSESVVAVESGILPYYLHYFPKGAQFEARDPLFKTRPFDYSAFGFARLKVIFAGEISSELSGRPVVLVGRIQTRKNPKDNPVLECDAIVPMTDGKIENVDYANVVLAAAPVE